VCRYSQERRKKGHPQRHLRDPEPERRIQRRRNRFQCGAEGAQERRAEGVRPRRRHQTNKAASGAVHQRAQAGLCPGHHLADGPDNSLEGGGQSACRGQGPAAFE